jgi:hypothetical protein
MSRVLSAALFFELLVYTVGRDVIVYKECERGGTCGHFESTAMYAGTSERCDLDVWGSLFEDGNPFHTTDCATLLDARRTCTDGWGGSLDYMQDNADSANKGRSAALYYPNLSTSGVYELSEWHPGANPQCSEYLSLASFEVSTQGSSTFRTTINQQENGGQWNQIGYFNLAAGEESFVRLASLVNAPCATFFIADAIKFVLVEGEDIQRIARAGLVQNGGSVDLYFAAGVHTNEARQITSLEAGTWDDDLQLLKDSCADEVSSVMRIVR